ncbi:SDR family NAD(P)-dependent oxidoreductase [Piscinibacter sp. XHJ-5]|uniref:SDR family oxidoreductase n=1 Tax=Piscinibacter sp. XHJ-5 TaxID=3037797 RepID=UPI00245349BA|nr:SDR family NAD(P)-dependent oxidoreductase [Piscinibacter sp. XHJ-5]
MTSSLAQRTALITGAGSGLGAALARNLFDAGARVVLADLAADKAKAVAAQIDPEGQRTLAIACDVSQPEAVQAAVRQCSEHFGGLDVLVNNAGTDVTIDLEQLSIEDWDRVLATNLRGPFLLSKAALPALRKGDDGRGGHIVNIASTASRRAWANASAYHASKWGLVGLSQALYAELRSQGIRVSSVIVGGMKTPFLLERFKDIDTSKLQDPANVAHAVRFVLTMPRESIVPEIMVLPLHESSWP